MFFLKYQWRWPRGFRTDIRMCQPRSAKCRSQLLPWQVDGFYIVWMQFLMHINNDIFALVDEGGGIRLLEGADVPREPSWCPQQEFCTFWKLRHYKVHVNSPFWHIIFFFLWIKKPVPEILNRIHLKCINLKKKLKSIMFTANVQYSTDNKSHYLSSEAVHQTHLIWKWLVWIGLRN